MQPQIKKEHTMIQDTFIETTLDRAFTGLETILGVTRQEDIEKQKADEAKKIAKARKAKKKRLEDDSDYDMPF